ncbi:unnamed protein product, partial [Staurois parvus]
FESGHCVHQASESFSSPAGHRVIWQGSGAPSHQKARQRGSESTGMTAGTGSSGNRIVWLDSGHRVPPGMTAGTGSPGIRSFGSPAGHRVTR